MVMDLDSGPTCGARTFLFEQHLEARRAGKKIESQRMLMPMIVELSPGKL